MTLQRKSKPATMACPECGAQIAVQAKDGAPGRLEARCNHGDQRRFPYAVWEGDDPSADQSVPNQPVGTPAPEDTK